MTEVSVKDVAMLAQVSVGTVSNVLNRPDRVAPATRDRVNGAIAQLGFVRNDAARQLRAGRSRTVGLVVQDIANPFFIDLARGAEQRAKDFGYAILLGNSDLQDDQESTYLELFREQRVSGLLLSPLHESLHALQPVLRQGIPIVLVDRDASAQGFRSVSVDDVAGGALAAEHLIASGRRKLAYAGGDPSIRQIHDRLTGARSIVSAVAHCSISPFSSKTLTVEDGRALGMELGARVRDGDIDAIVAANDVVAIGVMQTLLAQGIRVPHDVAIIGYDDIAFADSAAVPLSSIRQPSARIGAAAVDMLFEPSDDTSVVFRPELTARASTGA